MNYVYFSDLTSLEQHCIVLACLHTPGVNGCHNRDTRAINCMHVSKEAPVQAAHLINASLLCMPIAYHSALPYALKCQKLLTDLSVQWERAVVSYWGVL